MNCEHARLTIGADPSASDPGLEAHLAGCTDCRGYQREMRRLDGDLHRAFDWPRGGAVGGGLPTRDEALAARQSDAAREAPGAGVAPASNVVPLRRESAAAGQGEAGRAGFGHGPSVRDLPDGSTDGRAAGTHASAHGAPVPAARRWAFAAGVLLAGVLAASFLALRPGDALATDLVAHMAEEPEAWSGRQAVPQSALDLVLRRSGVRLDRVAAGEVVYANSCYLRGRQVPHLVVQTDAGPVTVLVLKGEKLKSRRPFDEGGYRGVLWPVPGGGGAIAVLARDAARAEPGAGSPDIEAAAARVLQAVDLGPDAPSPGG